jgi:hypothetical protein
VRVGGGQGYTLGGAYNLALHILIICFELTTGRLPPFGVVVEPELFSLSAQGIAMNSQGLGGL